jgi:peptidoglycan/xylan/chitin deacetylase (PgdA/CDA1 family)
MLEDVDLLLRLQKAGARFCYEPDALVWHQYKKSACELVNDAAWAGRNLILLCRKSPEYRRHSSIAAVGRGSALRRFIRVTAAQLPLSPDPLLGAPFALLRHFSRIKRIRASAINLLDLRMTISAYRGALKQVGSWTQLHGEFGIRLPSLLYHDISHTPTRGNPELTVTPERFERQVAFLARRGYIGICPSDWLAWVRQAKPLPAKPVVFSFDDGYAGLDRFALPILNRYGFSAVIYIITGKIGQNISWNQSSGSECYSLMTADQISYWASRGFEFGSHTRTHPDLTGLTSNQLNEEIAASAAKLESVTGIRPISFAYPFGSYNQKVVDIVRSHYSVAMTCDEGLNDLATDLCLLRRAMVQPGNNALDLTLLVTRGQNPLDHARAQIRLRTRLRAATRAVVSLTRIGTR